MEVEGEEKAVIYAGGVLDDSQLLDALALVSSYREYWKSKKFEENWDKPLCDLKKVEHLLEEAAEIVTEIRTKLGDDETDAPIAGSAKEYLLSLEELPSEEEFVLDLIHATFQRGDKSYLSNLTMQSLDRHIADIVYYNSTHQSGSQDGPLSHLYREGSEFESKLLKKWEETNALIRELANEEHKIWTSSMIENLRAIDNSIDIVNHQLAHFKNRRAFKKSKSLSSLLTTRKGTKGESPKKENPKEEMQPETKSENQEKEDGGDDIKVDEPQSSTPVTTPSQSSPELNQGMLVIETVHKNADEVDHNIKDLVTGIQQVKTIGNPKEAMTTITALKKKAAIYLDTLMKDLIKLDELSGESIRAARKMEVTKIQNIMDGIEALQTQMHQFELEIHPAVEKLEKEEKEQAEAREAEEKEKERIAKEKQEAELKAKLAEQLRLREEAQIARRKELKKSLEDTPEDDNEDEAEPGTAITTEVAEEESPWRRLKLEVELSVTEKPNGYVITGNIPGMLQKDIKIKVDNNSLIISGFREPSETDLQQMKRILTARGFQPRNPKELLGALLKIGVGRFGTFQQTYKLPADGSVDTSKVEAQYTHGTLRVVVPKTVVQQTRPAYPQRGGYRPGNRPGFFQDPSVWW